jgi:hypothetical protein
MQLDDRNVIKRLLAHIPKTIKIGFFIVCVLISISCIWFRVSSARIIDQNGVPAKYRVYRSIWGNLILEDQQGVMTIIYRGFSSVTDPESDAPLFHSDSCIVLDPIRSFLPADMPLTLSHDPRLFFKGREVHLNLKEKERITIKF